MATLKKRSSELNLNTRKTSLNNKRKPKATFKRSQSMRGTLEAPNLEKDDGVDKNEKMKKIEMEIINLQNTMTSLDNQIGGLLRQIDEKMPAYNQARTALGLGPDLDHKKPLVFHGVELDSVRMELIKDPSYTQDILEARLRSVMFEQLNITRDIPMDKVCNITTVPFMPYMI